MDYFSATALYFQVKEHIKKYIDTNNLKIGDKLPSENELIDFFKISRITVRRALDELQHEGYIERIHGKGTYVSSKRIVAQLAYLTSFTEDMEERGFRTRAVVVENRIVNPSAEILENLNLDSNQSTVFIKRIRYADETAIAIEDCYLSAVKFAGLTEEDFSVKSLNQVMESRFGINFAFAKQTIGAMIAPKNILQTFGLGKVAILVMKRIAYDITNTPVQYTMSYYRSDLYEYEVQLPMKKQVFVKP